MFHNQLLRKRKKALICNRVPTCSGVNIPTMVSFSLPKQLSEGEVGTDMQCCFSQPDKSKLPTPALWGLFPSVVLSFLAMQCHAMPCHAGFGFPVLSLCFFLSLSMDQVIWRKTNQGFIYHNSSCVWYAKSCLPLLFQLPIASDYTLLITGISEILSPLWAPETNTL